MDFKDLFSAQASEYSLFRPTYPPELFAHLASLVPQHSAAWDVGCGNGQASVELAKHFSQVYATDPSAKQLENAQANPRVRYSLGSAENSGLAPNSVNLTISAQAFHWFKHDAFATEVRRVSKPGAVVCVWCYDLCEVDNQTDSVVLKLYKDILGPYWDVERQLVEEKYASIVLPFQEILMPTFEMQVNWSLNQFVGYMQTWSALQKYIRANKKSPVEFIQKELSLAFGESGVRKVRWELSPRAWQL